MPSSVNLTKPLTSKMTNSTRLQASTTYMSLDNFKNFCKVSATGLALTSYHACMSLCAVATLWLMVKKGLRQAHLCYVYESTYSHQRNIIRILSHIFRFKHAAQCICFFKNYRSLIKLSWRVTCLPCCLVILLVVCLLSSYIYTSVTFKLVNSFPNKNYKFYYFTITVIFSAFNFILHTVLSARQALSSSPLSIFYD